ncbi:Fatty acyl-CoA reductase [Hordeum vulgare]|nr:Fatty acyl-CoA reductase [Hordeum vulgare]
MLFGIRFQRAWIQVPPSLPVLSFPFLCSALTARCSRQGMVVRVDYCVGDRRLFVDDGPCVTELMLRPADAKGQPWRPGSPNLSDFCLALFDFYTMSLDEKGRDRWCNSSCYYSMSTALLVLSSHSRNTLPVLAVPELMVVGRSSSVKCEAVKCEPKCEAVKSYSV